MEIIKEISNTDLCEYNSIVQEYLHGINKEELAKKYNDNIFVGYYLDSKIIGVCFGNNENKSDFILSGIAIIHPYNKQGRGGYLLKYFEDIVKSKGYKNITLGSGGGYVEHFYLKNGYKLQSLKILTDNDKWKEKEKYQFPITRIETQGRYKKLVIENIKYEGTDKQKICDFYCGCDCFYVFEKKLI
jgi:GNAT superfamily N-acetyltransferase